jgi:hypothetical protein
MKLKVAVMTKRNRKRLQSAIALIAFGLCCTVVVGLWFMVRQQGLQNWDKLNQFGVYGDSFGRLGALFAGLALIGAFVAAYFQWIALKEERESGRAEAVKSRFFQLVGSLQNAVNTTRRGKDQGRQAMRKVLEDAVKIGKMTRTTIKKVVPDAERRADINQWFLFFYHGEYAEDGTETRYPAGDLLGHLFRLTYHIVKYIDEAEAADADDKKFYIRILRAHLSNPELVLLMYNAIADYGKEKMFKLIDDHDLLQNIDLKSLPDVEDAMLFPSLRPRVEEFKAKG